MAFIVPVVRKDYNLFLAAAPQFPPKKSKTAAGGGGVKNARLSKSLPLFPTTAKSAAGEIRRQCSAMNHNNRSHRQPDARRTVNTALDARTRAGTTVDAGTASRRATYPLGDGRPPTRSVGGVDISQPSRSEGLSAGEGIARRSAMSHKNESTVSSPLDINLPADSGYPTSASVSPTSSTSESPSTSAAVSSTTMSAPASPILHRRPTHGTVGLRRSDATSASSYNTSSAEDDGDVPAETSPIAATRHVHFGFCEQIEYERPLKWHDGEPSTKYGRLKRFEQKLAAQLKSKLLFRPRAYSMPLPNGGLLSRKSHIALKDELPDRRLAAVNDHLTGRPAEIPPV